MALMVDISILDEHSEAVGAQFTFLPLSWSIFDELLKFFFRLKAYENYHYSQVSNKRTEKKVSNKRTWWIFRVNE